LAQRIHDRALSLRPKRELTFKADIPLFSNPDPPVLKVLPNTRQTRSLIRAEMFDAHERDRIRELQQCTEEQVQEEEYEEEEEETIDSEVAKIVAEQLQHENPAEISDDELQHRLSEKVAEARRLDDAEEIMRIIQIITGQWRSGRLRMGGGAEEGLDLAFQGTDEERERLEEKRRARNQRRARVIEERKKKMHTAEDIRKMIDRVMWMQAGQAEGASAADMYRGEAAMMSERDPRKEVLEKLEMNAFLRERRAGEALKERRSTTAGKLKRIERVDSGGEFPGREFKLKAADIAKKQNPFSFIVRNRTMDATRPQKQAPRPRATPSEELALFLNRTKDGE
jgi:hypothetical protein